jgi:hypothetical protein
MTIKYALTRAEIVRVLFVGRIFTVILLFALLCGAMPVVSAVASGRVIQPAMRSLPSHGA